MPPGDSRPMVLVVDDDASARAGVRLTLEPTCRVLEACDGTAAIEILATRPVDLCVLDLRLPNGEEMEVLDRIRCADPGVPVILLTEVPSVPSVVAAMKLGACDHLAKPVAEADLHAAVRRAVERRATRRDAGGPGPAPGDEDGFEQLVGASPPMRRLYETIRQIADHSTTVLITGESGTGKELIARAIHRHGVRRARPFVAVNCAALPAELLESELFGHERGAFTGANGRKPGKFELAHSGTLFLDEIASLRLDLQPKLLRALQEREIERVGGSRPLPVDVRIVAATNRDLRRAVAEGRFREDLFYRLEVVPIVVPALRERREDVVPLARHFLARYARQFERAVTDFSAAALAALERHSWPGNVRELENLVARSVALAPGPVIQLEDLAFDLATAAAGVPEERPLNLREARQELERRLILCALERAGGNQTAAARLLGMHRNTLCVKLAQLGLRPGDPRGRFRP